MKIDVLGLKQTLLYAGNICGNEWEESAHE